MNTRFIVFLLIVIAVVVALVIIEQNRENPWDSDVFFGQAQPSVIFTEIGLLEPHDEPLNRA